MPWGAPTLERLQVFETLRGVCEIGIVQEHSGKPLASIGNVAGSFVEIAQRVPKAKVVGTRTLRLQRSALKYGDCISQSALIGKGAGHNDAPLSDKFRRRR